MSAENIENYYIYWHGNSVGFSLSEDDEVVPKKHVLATLELVPSLRDFLSVTYHFQLQGFPIRPETDVPLRLDTYVPIRPRTSKFW